MDESPRPGGLSTIVAREERKLEGGQDGDLAGAAAQVPGVVQRVAHLEPRGDGLEQVGVEPAAQLVPADVGDDDALVLSSLLQAGEGVGGDEGERGPDLLPEPAQGSWKP